MFENGKHCDLRGLSSSWSPLTLTPPFVVLLLLQLFIESNSLQTLAIATIKKGHHHNHSHHHYERIRDYHRISSSSVIGSAKVDEAWIRSNIRLSSPSLFSSLSSTQQSYNDRANDDDKFGLNPIQLLNELVDRYKLLPEDDDSILTINADALSKENPIPAEMYAHGRYQPCLIYGFLDSSSSSSFCNEEDLQPPLVQVIALPLDKNNDGNNSDSEVDATDFEEKVVDMGQITTIWNIQNNNNNNTPNLYSHSH